MITGVRIVTGTTALGPSETAGVDLVVMDDFLYAEPQVVPGPIAGAGLPGLLPLASRWSACVVAQEAEGASSRLIKI